MFYKSTGITDLSSWSLDSVQNAKSMFYSCRSLVKPPKLPATELEIECYELMFGLCESLTEMPELPATELPDKCYNSMFVGCISLTEAK